jgi:hypothetical protein
MWLGIGSRIKPWRLLEVVGITALFPYLAGWVKGQKSAKKGEK